jgi:hypothetical protein
MENKEANPYTDGTHWYNNDYKWLRLKHIEIWN